MYHFKNNLIRWESDLEVDERDERKCLAPEKDRCGRSPTTMTLDHYSLLDMSGDLFARKVSFHCQR